MAGKGIPWDEVRKAWESGATVVSLSQAFSVSEVEIRRIKRRDGWVRGGASGESQPGASSSNAFGSGPKDAKDGRSNLISFPGGRRPFDRVRENDDEADAPIFNLSAEVTDEQIVAALRAAALAALEDLAYGRILPGMHQSKADVYKSAIDAAAKAIDKSRDVAGKKPGTPSASAPDEEEVRIDEAVLVVRERVA